ncbi:MAG: leucine-rich repeat domain-containing protein [Clostridia bacterium]|nr:leucine-rich repeat domain-containing protein [Clostridia bacterium]
MTYIQEFDGNVKTTGVTTDTLFYEQRATKGLVFRVGEADVGVVGYNGNVKHIYIPDFWNGLPITYIDVHAFQNAGIVSVRLPKHLELVDDYAFAGCSSLASIDLGEEISRIGENAFDGCSSLAKVKIGATVLPSYDETSFGELALNPKLIRPAKVETAVAWEQIADTFGFDLVVDYFNGNAETSTSAVQDGDGNNIVNTYAKQNGNYPNLGVGYATAAYKAEKTAFTNSSFTEYELSSPPTLSKGTYQFNAICNGIATSAMVYFDGTHATNKYVFCRVDATPNNYDYDSVFFIDIASNGGLLCSYLAVDGGMPPSASSILYRKIN